jgi:single-strand DNA-binding protein
MASFNRVFIIGNLTHDPEVRYIPSGTPVADLQMAVNRTYKTSSGDNKEETCFVSVVAWGRQAETAGEYLKKGSSIFVEGRLQFDQWENDNGEKRSRLRVRAIRIQFLDKISSGSKTQATNQDSGSDASPETDQNNEEKSDSDDLPF